MRSRSAWRSPYGIVTALIVAIALAWAAFDLRRGPISDDFALFNRLQGGEGAAPSCFDLWNWSPGDARARAQEIRQGHRMWYGSTHFQLALRRPLPSALVCATHAVAGERWAAYVALFAVMYAAMMLAIAYLFRAALPPAIAGWALVLVLASPGQLLAAGLFSACHMSVALGFASLGLALRIESSRRERSARMYAAALGAYVLALASSEVGFVAMVYALAYELLGASGRWRERLLRLTHVASILVAYLVIYRLTGSGARGDDAHIDPLREPLRFAGIVPQRVAAMLAQIGWTGSDGVSPLSVLAKVAIPVFVLAVIAMMYLRRRADADLYRTIRWLVAGAVAALLVGLTGPPSAMRTVFVPALGVSALMAATLVTTWRASRTLAIAPLRWLARAAIVLATFERIVPEVGIRQLAIEGMNASRRSNIDRVHAVDLGPPRDVTAVVIAGDDDITCMWGAQIRAMAALPPVRRWYCLSLDHPVQLRRTAADEVEIASVESSLNPWHEDGSLEMHVQPGAVVELDGIRITVLRVVDGEASIARLHFAHPLEDGAFVLLDHRTDGALVAVVPPPLGTSRTFEP